MEGYDCSRPDAEREIMALPHRPYRPTKARHSACSDATDEQGRSSSRSSVPLLLRGPPRLTPDPPAPARAAGPAARRPPRPSAPG